MSELTGFNIIGEMTRDQLIEEILNGQRRILNNATDETLIDNVIMTRLHHYKLRLLKEANKSGDDHHGLL